MTELDSQRWFLPPTVPNLFKPKFLCLSHGGSLVQLIVDVLMDAQRSMVEGSFPNRASGSSSASQSHTSLLFRQQLTWEGRT